MHLHLTVVELGEVEITEELSSEQRLELKNALLKSGLELLEDKKSMLIEKIKNIIIDIRNKISRGLDHGAGLRTLA